MSDELDYKYSTMKKARWNISDADDISDLFHRDDEPYADIKKLQNRIREMGAMVIVEQD